MAQPMRTQVIALVLGAAAACSGPAHQTPAGPAAPAAPAAGCPGDLGLDLATIESVGGLDRWVLFEAIVPDEKDDLFVSPEKESGGQREITRAAALAHGARDSVAPVWLWVNDDEPACRLEPGRHLAFRGGDGPFFTRVGLELVGDCPLPGRGAAFAFGLAARQETPPTDCRLRSSRKLGGRLESDEPAAAVPAELDRPDLGCQAPACERLWQLSGVDLDDGTGVYELTVSDVHRDPAVIDCEWKVDDGYALWVRLEKGQRPVDWPKASGLAGVLHDRGGLRAVVTEENGVLRVYARPTLDGGKREFHDDTRAPGATLPAVQALLVRELTWWIPNEESWVRHSLGPYCGP